MKHAGKKWTATIVALAMICSLALSGLAPLHVMAAEIKTMAHLKAGSENGNSHFGGVAPEAFILSDKKAFTDEAFGFTMRVGSTKAETRFRFVNKYVDDTHWSYIAYDGASGWFAEYKNGDASNWPGISGLPALNQNDMVKVTGAYTDDKLTLQVVNETSGEKGTAEVTDQNILGLAEQEGQIGFGAAKYNSQFTEVYFADVVVGETAYSEYTGWTLYKEDAGQIWNPAVDVTIVPDAPDPDPDPDPTPSGEGRAWWTITGGANNAGGHAYGNAGAKAPVLLLDNDKQMEKGTLSLAVKPSNNWGVFYSYIDDSNWLYVGWDSSSHWYYQYKINGAEQYPQIGGFEDPVPGEEVQMSVSLGQETLAVTVNGVTKNITNQALLNFPSGGRFGVKTNGATSISFADVTYNGKECMEDNWGFCAERDGQRKEKTYTKVTAVTGSVIAEETGEGLEGATVRMGANSAVTDAEGKYRFEALELGTYSMAVTKMGYVPYEEEVEIKDGEDHVFDVTLSKKAPLDLSNYDVIQSDVMKVYIGKEFPLVARYQMLAGGEEQKDVYFRGNEADLNEVQINGTSVVPVSEVTETTETSRTYKLVIKEESKSLDLAMWVKISVKDNTLTWKVTKIKKAEGCAPIAAINVDKLNLLSVDAGDEGANFAGAVTSTTTTVSGDSFIDFEDGFVPSESAGYLYGFLSNGKLSAGLYSNSEAEGDKRVVRNNGADTMALTSAKWYYELGDAAGQKNAAKYAAYPLSDLPCAKVAIAADANGDGDIDWNDGALEFRKIMNKAYGYENIANLVNYRIVMNFASMVSNPYLTTADNIKKVALATDGLPQAVMLKGYGSEGHDSANSEYADIAEREGGAEDFRKLIKIAHDYDAEIGIHVNAQEAYPEAASFNEEMLVKPLAGGWGWLDQSQVIDKLWDLSSQARYKRFVQLYDRINNTCFYNREWPKAVENSLGEITAPRKDITADAKSRKDNMDFIYLDVWYQDAWETRQIAKEINSLGWRFSTEFSAEGEYDSTWQHWSTDASYGGASMKGYNSDIIRFLRNDQRDSQVLNYPQYGGTADNPLLGGYRLYGFEGWGGDNSFNNYILQTFNQNLPTKFLQHYYVTDWENYEKDQSPVGNHEKQITLKNDNGDTVVVTRNEAQRKDDNIERTITLNGRKVLDDVAYLLPWTDSDGTEKLYHWNLDGGTTTWELPEDWSGLENVVVYKLTDQGRVDETNVAAANGAVTLNAEKATAYVVVRGAAKKQLKNDFGEADYVADPGFNGYADGAKPDAADWSGDIDNEAIVIEKAETGDQRLAFHSPKEDVAIKTTISGLKADTDYVAEVYVENNSKAKASITVDTGNGKVSNYTEESILNNYVQCDQKHGTRMQRMQIAFRSAGTTAELTLSRAAGEGSTYMDDIRIVKKTLNNFREDGSFVQDFESVVQGLYPFVLSSAQGVSDPVTHLSQLHAPYTQMGWNGRVIDDVIDGEWSLKQHGANSGIIYQTLPQNFRFEPGKLYKVEFDYQSGPDKAYAMVVGDGTNYYAPEAEDYLAAAHGRKETQHVTMQVYGSKSGQTWIGLFENAGKAGSGSMGQTDFILDNLKITEDPDSNFVQLEKTELYKGETAAIYGNKLDTIQWTSSDEAVAAVDKAANKVKALAGGTATITATFEDGETTEFEITVVSEVVVDIPREEYADITATANTEESVGEGAGNGCAVHAVDNDKATFWHSQWAGTNFTVSPDNPAILTVDFGKTLEIGGFKFLQRNGNGLVEQYSYQVLDEEGNVLTDKQHVKSSANGGQWETAALSDNVMARKVVITVEVGKNGNASMVEFAPIRLKKVAEEAALEDITILVGETVTLTPAAPEGTMLTGIVWKSSSPDIALVSQEGLVKGMGAGKAVISISNAAGLHAECTVTVEYPKLDYTSLNTVIEEASGINLRNYKDDGQKEAFLSTLREAKALVDHGVTQQEVDDMTAKLSDAVKALNRVEIPKAADTKKLKDAIKKAEAVDPEKYEDGAEKERFVKALEDAKSAMQNASAQATVDAACEELLSAQKALESVKAKDTEPPTVPTNLSAKKVKETSMSVSWKASKDNEKVAGYEVYVNGQSIGTVTGTSIDIKDLKAGTKYQITVKAYDEAGNYSEEAGIKVETKAAKKK